MEQNSFIIECRYEIFTIEGKKFINWFVYDSTPRTETEALNKIKEIKKNLNFIDNKTKLSHEYRICEYQEYLNRLNALKETIKENKERFNEYLKSSEYKELLKKKRISAKERKEKQQKYLEEHIK